MTAQIIDGKALSRRLRVGFRERVERLKERGVSPGLAVILVGDNPASRVYVGNKIKACQECGVMSLHLPLPADASEAQVLATIDRLNADAGIHGILVQLPLPPHIQIARVLEAISVHKDVDGFHLYNVGALVTGNSIFPPCTPYGVLLQREATVTICHAKTRDLAQHTILADVLIVAAGKPGLIVPQMVKEGAIVIDVGINRLPDGRIVGDVCFDEVKEKASWITPVPGGVGPMTVTMLIENTLRSAERAFKAADEDEFQEWEAPIVKSP